jgi:heat shock protein HtpX
MSAPRPTEPPPTESRRERIAREVSAYPGTVTFNDLIRKNKRQSVVLIVLMLLLCLTLGAALGAAAGVYAGGGELPSLLPSVAIGAGAAILVGGLGTVWSWFSGSSAILRMMGAVEIEKGADQELFNVVDEMRIAAGLPMPRVYLVNDTALNAFATGRDPEHGVVAVTRGLREKLTRDELQAVVAHEMAHIRHFDIRFAMLMATMVGLIVFACDAFWRITFHAGRSGGGRRSGGKNGGGGAAVIVVLVLAVLLAVLAPIVARFIQMAYSREREYLADAGAVELTRNPLALAGALSRIAGDDEPLVEAANRGTAHMFIANPLKKARAAHQNINSLFSSHPPMDKRIARILALTR